MNGRIRDLILLYYAFPFRTIERDRTRQYGERSVRWHG